jgi:hypothetical protein
MAAKEKGRSTVRREKRLDTICVEFAEVAQRVMHERDPEKGIRSGVESLAHLHFANQQVRLIRLTALGDPGGVELEDADVDPIEFADVRSPRPVRLKCARGTEEIRGEVVVGIESRG